MQNNQNKFKETEIGLIPEDWEVDLLGNRADIIMGQSPEGKYYNSVGDGLLFMQGVRTFGEKYPTFDTWTTSVTKKAPAKSVLISVRAPVGDINITPDEMCIGRGLAAINAKNGNNEYVYQLLEAYRDKIVGQETGTVYGSISRDDIFRLELPFAPDLEQQKIAEVLGALDDEIELNRKMNKTLESLGQAIFNDYFGHFEQSEKSYKTTVGDFAEIIGGTTPKTNTPEYWDGEFDWATPRDMSSLQSPVLLKTERRITAEGLKAIGSGQLPKGTLLLSSRAPIGYLAFANMPVAINQGFIAIKSPSNYYLYFWLKQNMDKVIGSANGSTFLEISKSNFRRIELYIPDNDSLNKFDQIASQLINKIILNEKEIESLSKIRNSLLPRLMSGKLRVECGK